VQSLPVQVSGGKVILMTTCHKEHAATIIARNLWHFRVLEVEMSRGEVSQETGLSPDTIRKAETGVIEFPDTKTLKKLAEAYGRDLADFLAENPPPRRPATAKEPRLFFLKTAKGAKVDSDIREKIEKFLREQDREQLERIQKEKEPRKAPKRKSK
jgi:transcriptional regulator with XRE-family HTH domain